MGGTGGGTLNTLTKIATKKAKRFDFQPGCNYTPLFTRAISHSDRTPRHPHASASRVSYSHAHTRSHASEDLPAVSHRPTLLTSERLVSTTCGLDDSPWGTRLSEAAEEKFYSFNLPSGFHDTPFKAAFDTDKCSKPSIHTVRVISHLMQS